MDVDLAVLMCASNAESYIAESIESILNQTYGNFEFIIVENGSTDQTWDIIKSYKDVRIKPFRTKLKQLIFSLNYGLMQTTAKYIARMDADDIAYPQRLEKQISYFIKNPETTILGTAIELFGEKDFNKKFIYFPESNKEIRKRLPYFFSICHPSVMFKREDVLNFNGYEQSRLCEDLDLWLRMSRDKKTIFANLSEPLLKYRIHRNQIRNNKNGYYMVASILFKEALINKDIRCFLGMLLTFLKSISARNSLK